MEMFEEKLFRQIIDFPTCGNNILDTAYYQNCHLSAELDKSFPSIYNLTDHEATRLSLENPVTETKPLLQNFRSFGNAEHDAINEHLVENSFLCNIMHSVLRNIKRLRKIPDRWKVAAITPMFKKSDRRKIENYRPVSLLNIDSKILEKCIHIALYNHFQTFLTRIQHGFVRRRSVQTNILLFLKKINEALDHDPQSEIIAFYTDFSKAFDKVPHHELIQEMIDIGVGGCLLEILIDYLSDQRSYVRLDNTSSKILDITSGVPQGSLLGPILFCIFINDLPDVVMFSEPFIFADDLKIFVVQRN